MEIHDAQSENLGSPVYTLHIQETNEEFPSSQLVLINNAESMGNGTISTQNPLLEIDLDIVKIGDWQESERGKTGLFLGMGNKITKSTDIDDTGSANHEYDGKTGSSELNGNTSESEAYHGKMVQVQTKEITKSYLNLKEAAFAVHGLDLSLPIECDMCNIEFDDLEKFDAHMKEHEETKRYMCQLCSKTYMSWQNLVAHRKVCHNGQFISCDHCSLRKIHYSLGPINYPVGDFPFGCEECNKGFTTHNELNRHYRSHPEKNTVEFLENMLNETRKTVERSEVDSDSDNEHQEEKSEVFSGVKLAQKKFLWRHI